jgi:hypothetical protein
MSARAKDPFNVRRRRRMFWLVGLIVVMVAAYIAAWQWDLLPRDVIATGTVTVGDGKVLEDQTILPDLAPGYVQISLPRPDQAGCCLGGGASERPVD